MVNKRGLNMQDPRKPVVWPGDFINIVVSDGI